MAATNTLRTLIGAARRGDMQAYRLMAKRLEANPLQLALFGGRAEGPMIDQRLHAFHLLFPIYRSTMSSLCIPYPRSAFLFDTVLPLAQFVSEYTGSMVSPLMIGMAGGPGVGKTTLYRVLINCLAQTPALSERCLGVSLDDFYLPRNERLRRGHRWRTLPGTHNMTRVQSFITAIDSGRGNVKVPRYDLAADAPLADEMFAEPPAVCLFEGAMVGGGHEQYAALARRLDFLIYFDAPVYSLKKWRYARERKIRKQSAGRAGYSPQQMHAFWNEALEPSIEHWVEPIRRYADLVVEVGAGRQIANAHRQQEKARAQGES